MQVRYEEEDFGSLQGNYVQKYLCTYGLYELKCCQVCLT